ncbi:MAG: glutathione S-transferase N-terminal domain-containing protein [Patescibacteria group bacterium]
MTLYVRQGCQYCQRVLSIANQFGIILDIKDIADPHHDADLVARGGMHQVPFLVDEAKGIEMYESVDIVAYLTKEYATKRP